MLASVPPRRPRDRAARPAPGPVTRTILDLSRIEPRPLAWLWPGRIPLGTLTILDGDPGLGKSTLLLDLAARLTTATPMPDPQPPNPLHPPLSTLHPHPVLLLSAEDDPATTLRPRLEAAGAELARCIAIPFQPRDPHEEPFRIPRDLSDLARLVARSGARLVIVDPLLPFLDPRVSPHSDRSIRNALAPLVVIAERLALAVVLVRHLTKQPARSPLHRGSGSIGLIGLARSGLLVARDPDDPSGARCLLLSTKANLAAPPPTLAYRLATAPNGASIVRWDGHSPHTPETALAGLPTDTTRPDALAEAKAILTAILADGPLPADAVRRQAAQAGLGPNLLWRSKLALGIRSHKVGGPRHSVQSWLWNLPDQATTLEGSGPDPSESS
jgi:hypothetical protein